MHQCAYCGVPIDHAAAASASEAFAKVNQAISDASYLTIMGGCALGFFLVQFVPFLSLIGWAGLLFLQFAIPFMTIRWLIKYAQIESPDPEFRNAKRNAILVGFLAVFVIILLHFPH
jgi:hypothetical protein